MFKLFISFTILHWFYLSCVKSINDMIAISYNCRTNKIKVVQAHKVFQRH